MALYFTYKILEFNDPHIQVGADMLCRKDIYWEALLEKFKDIGRIIKNENIDAVLIGGDLVQHPDVSSIIVREFVREIMAWKVPVFINPGNHDLYGHNPNSLWKTQMSLIDAAGIVTYLAGDRSEIKLFPKTSEESFDLYHDAPPYVIRITASPFRPELDKDGKADDYISTKKGENEFLIHLTHGMVVDRPIFNADCTLLKDFWDKTDADVTYCAHDHVGFGEIRHDGKLFINPGALGRVNADLKEFSRAVKCSVLEIKGSYSIEFGWKVFCSHSFYSLKSARPAAEVLSREHIIKKQEQKNETDLFFSRIDISEAVKKVDVVEALNAVAAEEEADKAIVKSAKERIYRVLEARKEISTEQAGGGKIAVD